MVVNYIADILNSRCFQGYIIPLRELPASVVINCFLFFVLLLHWYVSGSTVNVSIYELLVF